MSKAIIANNKPASVTLEKGSDYYFCTCGKSASQPFCDGSHSGSDFTPQKFTAEKDGEAWLCACKQSSNLPFCDGSHQSIADDLIGKTVD